MPCEKLLRIGRGKQKQTNIFTHGLCVYVVVYSLTEGEINIPVTKINAIIRQRNKYH